MRLVRTITASQAFAAGLFLAVSANAAELAGTTAAADTLATASGRELAAKSDIFLGDEIATNETGLAQLIFRDDTKMVVGPNSELTIDEFVYSSNNTVTKFTVDATRGAFRFITGLSNSSAYEIETPVATIGFRGTQVDIDIDENGGTCVANYGDTSALLCTGGTCARIEGNCTVVCTPGGSGAEAFTWIKNIFERTDFIEDEIPYAFREANLQSPFRVESGSCEFRGFYTPDPEGHPDESPPPDDEYDDCKECID